jgi:hypothetical protein
MEDDGGATFEDLGLNCAAVPVVIDAYCLDKSLELQ